MSGAIVLMWIISWVNAGNTWRKTAGVAFRGISEKVLEIKYEKNSVAFRKES